MSSGPSPELHLAFGATTVRPRNSSRCTISSWKIFWRAARCLWRPRPDPEKQPRYECRDGNERTDRFQTVFRPVPCRMHYNPCRSVSSPMHSSMSPCHVGCTVPCRVHSHSLDRNSGGQSESGPMLVGRRSVDVLSVRFLLR